MNTPIEASARPRRWKTSALTWWLALMAITLLGGVLRFYRLGTESFWLDEGLTWHVTHVPWTLFLKNLLQAEVAPPLYAALISGWVKLMGESEVMMRLPSCLAGILTVPLLGSFVRRLLGPGPALLSAFFLALSPAHIWYSQETRNYSLFTLLVLFSTAALVWAWQSGSRRSWCAYLVLTLATCYTHYFAVYFLVGQGLFISALTLLERKDRGSRRPRRWRAWFGSVGMVGVLYLLWLPFMAQSHWSYGTWIKDTLARLSPPVQLGQSLIAPLLGHRFLIMPQVWVYLISLGILGLMPVGLWSANSKLALLTGWLHFSNLLWLATIFVPVVIAWTVSQFRPSLIWRYVLPISPFAFALIGQGIWRLRPVILRLLVIGSIVATQSYILNRQIAQPIRPDWRGLAAFMLDHTQRGEALVVEPAYQKVALEYYLRDQLPPILNLESLAGNTLNTVPSIQPPSRLWVIQGGPLASSGTASLQAWLDAHATSLLTQNFRDLQVKLYQLNFP